MIPALAMLALACGGEPSAVPSPSTAGAHALHGEAMGTTWTVRWRGEPGEDAAEAAIVRALSEVDAAMSSWRTDSEISAVRAAQGPVAVSEDTYAVVDAALSLAEATGGAFDPTVEPLMEVWGFRGGLREVPTDAQIEAARQRVGWSRVLLSRGPDGRPRIDGQGTALDLSAIAKGHAVDRVSNALSALGSTDHLVEVGGEVRAHGSGPTGPWRLGIDRPTPGRAPGEEIVAVVGLVNAGLATSGNYRSVREIEGRRVVHTMDPRTGRPEESEVLSASVIAPDCRTADGWATALMVLGEEGLPLVEARPDLEALLLVDDGAGGLAERATSGFERRRLDER